MSLRELPRVQQVAGEPRRRWFHGHEMDLVTREDAQTAPCSAFSSPTTSIATNIRSSGAPGAVLPTIR